VFGILRRVREELGVNTTCGASNVSFGLPNRGPLNAAFLSMAIAHGLTSAITNPLEAHIKEAILAADVMTGNDENCTNWIMANRQASQPEGEAAPAAGGRERRSRRRRRGEE
jgi:5-methyltetrahydrofolate--homocysteine methyltransferase